MHWKVTTNCTKIKTLANKEKKVDITRA